MNGRPETRGLPFWVLLGDYLALTEDEGSCNALFSVQEKPEKTKNLLRLFYGSPVKKREHAPVPLTHQSFAHTKSIRTILAVKTRIIKIVPALVKKQVRHLPSIRFASR